MTDNNKMAKLTRISEDRYRYLAENSGDMISTHRPGDWAYTAINPAVLAVSGYTPEEVLGQPAYDFFHPEDAEAMKRKLIPAIYRNGVRTFRYRHKYKNGKYHWLESTHRSIRDERTGVLKEIIVVSRNISTQIQVEFETRRLADVVEVSSDLILFCNRRFIVTYMNGSALRGFGLQELPSKLKLQALLTTESFAAVNTLAGQEDGEGSVWRGELLLQSPRFEQRYITLQEVLVHPQHSMAESPDYYALIIRDQTEQKRAEEDMQQQQSVLAHSVRLMTMGEMATGIAHEINQPLATTLNYAQGAIRQINDGKLTTVQELSSVLEHIAKQSRRAANIVKRLRAMVRKTPHQRQEFSVNSLCVELQDLMRHDLRTGRIELELRLSQEELFIDADRVQIEQVLVNLLRNAIEAYQQIEMLDKRIIIEVCRHQQHMSLTVTDFGAGISPGVIAKLFEPYASTKKKGLGMGLSISRTIVEAHGGAIEGGESADNKRGSCTQFSVSLPLVLSNN